MCCTMYTMKRYTVSKARARFADVLDEAEQHGAVLVERGDVQYVITAKRAPRRRVAKQSAIESVDPAVRDGQWQWEWTADGVSFRAGHSRR
jgi:hypothetical protein